ncbi:MAG: hypothetical protein HY984_01830, partial [Candidatus Magasanikbacteria bacterium]|nr:hypothetical protein [Candidatus Magasanikbacteria bacterium]
GTFDRGGLMRLYVDGRDENRVSIPAFANNPLATTSSAEYAITMGASLLDPGVPSYDKWFNGSLDEVQLYRRVLTASEIQSIYNAGSNGICKPDNFHTGCVPPLPGLIRLFTGDAPVAGSAAARLANGTGQCATVGGSDVTSLIDRTLAYRGGVPASRGWWGDLWAGVRQFFARLWPWKTETGLASNTRDSAVTVWCAGAVPILPEARYNWAADGTSVSTTVSLAIQDLLSASSTYAVILRGGPDGIKDTRGVPIRGATTRLKPQLDDSFIFRTGDETKICTLERITVDPTQHTFTVPNTSSTFVADAISSNRQRLVPIPGVYAWRWGWGPANHPIFEIPTADSVSTSPQVQIAARNVEGSVAAVVTAEITDDRLTGSVGQVLSAASQLRALFCERPWPPVPYYPYEDGNPPGRTVNDDAYYTTTSPQTGRLGGIFTGGPQLPVEINGNSTYFNFSLGYCADAGRGGTTTDDLPYLRPVILGNLTSSGSGSTDPVYLTSLDLPQFPGPGNAPVNVKVLDGIAYIVNENARTLQIVDVSNPRVPRYIGALFMDQGGVPAIPREVVVERRGGQVYAYVRIQSNGASQFNGIRVVNVTNPASPSFITSYPLSPTWQPLPGSTTTPYDYPSNMFFSDPYLYVGVRVASTTNRGNLGWTMDGSLYIMRFDGTNLSLVQSIRDSAVPVGPPLSGSAIVRLNQPDFLSVSRNYAYIVGGSGLYYLNVFDISNISNIRAVFTKVHINPGWGLLGGVNKLSADSNHSRLYLWSRQSSGGIFVAMDISTPGQVSLLGQAFFASSTYGFPTSLFTQGDYAFLTTDKHVTNRTGVDSLLAVNVRDSNNLLYVGRRADNLATGAIMQDPQSVYVDGNTAYIVNRISHNLAILDVTNVLDSGLSARTSTTNLPGALKKWLFFNEKNDDVIGVQVFANPRRLTAREWYDAAFQNVGIFREVNADGYTGITDGNNFYIDALNQRAARNDLGQPLPRTGVENYIYSFSLNNGAQANTKKVFAKLMESLRFNINMTDFGYCSRGNGLVSIADIETPDTGLSLSCSTDLDCAGVGTSTPPLDRVCANARTKMLRDWRRLHDIQVAQQGIEQARQSTGRYPTLPAGTYLPQYTNSRWSLSWGSLAAMARLVPGAPSDPVNGWTSCSPSDPQTCWSAVSSTFNCPRVASIYEYSASTTGADYLFHAPLEFFAFSNSSTIISEFVTTTHFTTARWCAASTTYSPFREACGDGVVNTTIGEQCDPPGITRIEIGSQLGRACSNPTDQTEEVCNASCQWQWANRFRVCAAAAQCGNNRVEPGEACDDGALNNTYGHCNDQCNGLFTAYCGNTIVDQAAGGQPLEQCDINQPLNQNKGFCANARGSAYDQIGTSWISQPSGVPTASLSSISIINRETALIAGRNGVVLKTFDGGRTWTSLSTPSPKTGFMNFVGSNYGWLVGSSSTVFFTNDGGNSWQPQTPSTNQTYVDFHKVKIINQNVGWIVGVDTRSSAGVILKTTNGGVTWQEQQSNSPDALYGLYFQDVDTGWVAGGNVNARRPRLIKTTDGGQTWIPQNVSVSSSLADILFTTSDEGWLVGSNSVIVHTSN